MSSTSWARLLALVLAALIVQMAVLNEIVILGAHPDVMILIAVAAGVVGGPVRGATFGFVSGLAADLAVNLPYGLSALTFVFAGFGAAYLSGAAAGRDLPGSRVVLVVLGALLGTVLYAIIGAIVGQPDMLGTHLVRVLIVVGSGGLVLGAATLRAVRWVLEPSSRPAGNAVPRGGSERAVRRRGFGRGMRRRRRQLTERNALRDVWLARSQEPHATLSPIVAVTTPSPTATASERTGARLTLRLSVTALVVLGLFSTLLVRLWSLQVIDGPQLNAIAKATTTRSVVLEPARGEILTRDGAVLAGSVAKEQVTIDPADASNTVIARLAALLAVTSAQITRAIADDANGPFAPVPVPTGPLGVTKGDVAYIETNPSLFPHVTVGLTYERTYPENALASQIIGYVSEPKPETEKGASGLEEEYDRALVGIPGGEQVEVDPVGDQVEQGPVHAPVAGDNVITNLSLGLEQIATNALASDVTELRAGDIAGQAEPAPWAAAVVLQTNGAVLAAASYPGYNNNLWVPYITTSNYNSLLNNPDRPLNDYVVSGLQPPGSTFKLATATAALNSGIISAGQYVDDTGVFVLGDKQYYDSDNEALGEVNVTSALAESSDYYFYNVGAKFWENEKEYGPTPIQNTAKSYGLGVVPAIDLPVGPDDAGQVDSAALRIALHKEDPKAYPYNTYFGGDNVDLAIGQGETVLTPLQMADAYEAFANGGTLYAPEIANTIVGPSGVVARRIAPKVVGHVSLPSSTYEPMLQGFDGTVQNSLGTAYAAFQGFNFSSWSVAGKTGTASTSLDDTTPPTAWFVGFGGPTNAPARYVVAVVVAQGGFGADAAAPVARTIFTYLQAHGVGPVKLPTTTVAKP